MSEMVGQTLGHDRLVEKIGVGGMVIYRGPSERFLSDFTNSRSFLVEPSETSPE